MTPMPFAAPVARALLRSQSDDRLVRLAKDGYEGAFEEIVRRYRAPLVAFAAAYAPAERAEDVVQESLSNAWTSLTGSDREIALKPWLYTIVRNRALNARRDTRIHEQLNETIDGVRRPEEIVLQRDELSRAVAAVVALPEAQRKALVDSAIEGRTHDQIAAELGTSPGSVRGLVHRGRVAVRGAMGSVVPMPILAWAAGSGGVAAGGAAAGSVAGGSLAAKGAAVAAIAVLATGSGIVVERSLNDSAKSDREAGAAETSQARGQDSTEASSNTSRGADDSAQRLEDPPAKKDGDDNSGPGGGNDGDGENEAGDDNSGPGGGGDDSGSGGGDDGSDSGPGSGGDDGGDSSGPGPGDEDGGDSDSGSGAGGDSSGSGGGDSSGSGGGDSSGSGGGDGDSGSGGSGSDSSGSGSGGGFDVEEVDD
jgi:RNA polymerase sigma factor (sigma-70 family)